MTSTLIAALVLTAASAGQYPAGYTDPGNGPGAYGFAKGDPYFPYDGPEPWLRGHWQEIPSYGGYHSFRPYNYKHVLSQSQVAGGWGMSPVMPYSQAFFSRYPSGNYGAPVNYGAPYSQMTAPRVQQEYVGPMQPVWQPQETARPVDYSNRIEGFQQIDPAAYRNAPQLSADEMQRVIQQQNAELQRLRQTPQPR